MSNTMVRDQHNLGNIQSGSGFNIITGMIENLPWIQAVTPAMISYASPEFAEENQRVRWRKEYIQENGVQINNGGGYTDSATSLVVDEADLIQVGQLLKNGAEWIRVTAIDSSTDTLTVTRGYAGTTAETLDDDQFLLASPQLLTELEDPEYTPARYGEFEHNNYALIGWKMGQSYWSTATPSYFTGDATSPDGQATRLAKAKRDFLAGPVMRQFEVYTWYGVRQAMTSSVRGSMRGIANFITTHHSAGTGELTMNAILDYVNIVRKKKGMRPDGSLAVRLYGNAKMLAIFTALVRTYYTSTAPVDVAITPQIRATAFQTDFGRLEFVTIDQLEDGELYGCNMDDISYIPLNMQDGPGGGWIEFEQTHIELGSLQRLWRYYFSGTLKVGHEENHFKLTGISTDESLYPNYVGPLAA